MVSLAKARNNPLQNGDFFLVFILALLYKSYKRDGDFLFFSYCWTARLLLSIWPSYSLSQNQISKLLAFIKRKMQEIKLSALNSTFFSSEVLQWPSVIMWRPPALPNRYGTGTNRLFYILKPRVQNKQDNSIQGEKHASLCPRSFDCVKHWTYYLVAYKL